jgi:hypothetical protein
MGKPLSYLLADSLEAVPSSHLLHSQCLEFDTQDTGPAYIRMRLTLVGDPWTPYYHSHLHIHNASTLRNAADAVGARSRLEGLEGCKHAALRGDLVGILSSMLHIALPCFNILSCARIICEAMDAQW